MDYCHAVRKSRVSKLFSGLKSVFEMLRFRDGLMWTIKA